ncbi:MAG: exosortase C-terminal domain/associated protein EpsI [Candidatus Binatia bacterium]
MKDALQALSSVGALLAALVFLHAFSHGEPIPLRTPLESLPEEIGRWRAREGTLLSEEVLRQLRLSDYLMRRYEDPEGRSLWLYIGYWASQRRGAQMHSPKHCLPGAGWDPLEAQRLRIDVGPPSGTIETNRFVVQNGSAQQVVLYWFQSQGSVVARELHSKLQLLQSALFRGRSDAAIVRLTAPVLGDIGETTQALVEYASALYPVLREALPD